MQLTARHVYVNVSWSNDRFGEGLLPDSSTGQHHKQNCKQGWDVPMAVNMANVPWERPWEVQRPHVGAIPTPCTQAGPGFPSAPGESRWLHILGDGKRILA